MEQSYLNKIRSLNNKASGMVFRNAIGDEAMTQSPAAQPIDPNDRTLTINVAPISSTVAADAHIFGYNLENDESYNTANNATVVIPESSHGYVKRNCVGNPFRVKGLLYTASSKAQLQQPFYVSQGSMAGAINTRVYQPAKFYRPTFFDPLTIWDGTFQMVVNADAYIALHLLAGATADLVLSIQDKVEIGQALSNRTPLQSALK
jgi:hypothetical protein